MGVVGVWVPPLWMDEMEKVVVVGGILVHPLWINEMEKVVGVGGLWVQPLWMDWIGNMAGASGDKPPRVVPGMVKSLGWKKYHKSRGMVAKD